MKMSAKTPFLARCVLAVALAAAVATPALAQPRSGGRPSERQPQKKPVAQDMRAMYREDRFVRHLYRGFLHREPSRDEVHAWLRRLDAGDRPIDLVRSFMDSDEYFVRETYRGLLGREPDPEGMEGYLRMLRRGGNRAEMVENILGSPEFRKALR